MRASPLHLLSSLGVLGVVAVNPVFAAEGVFPRGPGFYFHPAKLLLLLAVYFAWLRICWWVYSDCQDLKLPSELWNPLVLACGFAGLLFVWLLPLFWLGLFVLAVLCLAPTLCYVSVRNDKVAPEQRVLTPRHLRALLRRWL